MGVHNVHERTFDRPPAEVGRLIDSLASRDDVLWPRDRWPAMRFDRPLGVGAVGGHGPIRYSVEAYEPGKSVRFRFSAPRGFEGWHGFETATAPGGGTILRHVLEMETRGPASFTWPVVFRPLHDALIEDSLDHAAEALGVPAEAAPWSIRVRCLRWFLRPRRRKQAVEATRKVDSTRAKTNE